MIICPKCKKKLVDGSKFCDNCGTKIYPMIFCPNCGKQTSTEIGTCQNCGTDISSCIRLINKSDNYEPPVVKSNKRVIGFLKKTITVLAIILVLAAVVTAGVMFLPNVINFGSGDNIAYIKNKELNFNTSKKEEPFVLSSGLVNASLRDAMYTSIGQDIGNMCYLANDGKALFYPDKIEAYSGDGSSGFSLYYRDIFKEEKGAIKIDSGVAIYTVNKNASKVTYAKSKDGALYQYNVKKDEKNSIASSVTDFVVSDDGNTIIYIRKGANGLYRKQGNNDEEKIDTDVKSILYASETLDRIFYSKDKELYKIESNQEKEKICSSFEELIKVYDSGEYYYATKNTDNTSFLSELSYTLWFSDGKDAKIVSDTFTLGETKGNYVSATDTPVIAYQAYNQTVFDETNVTKSDIKYNISKALYASAEQYIAVKDVSNFVAQDEAVYVSIKADGSEMYFFDSNEEGGNFESYGDLYKVSISGDKVSKPEKFDSDVSANLWNTSTDNTLVYIKNKNKNTGELVINDKKVDDDVYDDRFVYDEKHGQVVYYTDYDEGKSSGTLTVCKNGKTKKIADEVRDFCVLDNGGIVYLYDFNKTKNKGELYFYKNEKKRKLDDEVTGIVPIGNLKYSMRFWKIGYTK